MKTKATLSPCTQNSAAGLNSNHLKKNVGHLHAFLIQILLGGMLLAACSVPESRINPTSDPHITDEALALFINLDKIRHDHVLFGHQDDLAYGVHWVNEPGRSDVRETTGSYPAVYGWELGDLELGASQNLDMVNFDNMRNWIKEGYLRGGVITLSWHMNNPVTGGNAWDTEGRAVTHVLPGGEKHELFVSWLDTFAGFVRTLRIEETKAGRPSHLIPILFRPFHEHNGSWFWWGADHCTPEEYVALWRFTVDYLRNEHSLHNLLYTYSPDRFEDEAHYLERYPGDAYVDLFGYDDYGNVRSAETVPVLTEKLEKVVKMAELRGKIPVLSETGLEQIPIDRWFTDILLKAITGSETSRRITYVLVWRNSNNEIDRKDHYYAPFPAHPAAANFIEFREHPFVLFEDDLPDMYRSGTD